MSMDCYMALLRAYAELHGGAQQERVREPTLVVDGQCIGLCLMPGNAGDGDAWLLARTLVGHLPGVPAATVTRMLAQANGCWSGAFGGALYLRGSDAVMLGMSQRMDALTVAGLVALLRSIAIDARRWQACLGTAAQQCNAAAAGDMAPHTIRNNAPPSAGFAYGTLGGFP